MASAAYIDEQALDKELCKASDNKCMGEATYPWNINMTITQPLNKQKSIINNAHELSNAKFQKFRHLTVEPHYTEGIGGHL